jgi:hypothetical protein
MADQEVDELVQWREAVAEQYATKLSFSALEEHPQFETHIGPLIGGRRPCIIWVNGERFEGYLFRKEN